MESLSFARRSGTALVPLLLLGSLGCGVVYGVSGCDRAPDPPPPSPESYATATFQYTSGNETRTVSGARVRPEFFGSAWTQPALGRVFVESDYAPDAEAVAIVSEAFWRESLDAAPTVIGGALMIDGMPAILVGVLPRGADFPPDARIWLPQRPQDR